MPLARKKNGRGKDCPAPENSVFLQPNGFAARVNALNLGEIITNDDAIKRIGDAEEALVLEEVHPKEFIRVKH